MYAAGFQVGLYLVCICTFFFYRLHCRYTYSSEEKFCISYMAVDGTHGVAQIKEFVRGCYPEMLRCEPGIASILTSFYTFNVGVQETGQHLIFDCPVNKEARKE